MGDERDDAANRRRADVYSSARIGAAPALTLVLTREAFLGEVIARTNAILHHQDVVVPSPLP
jgi:hypothetical protein